MTRHYGTIIVGGGVGGAACARFSTQHGRSCLVIEAGPMPRYSATCSGIFGATFDVLEARPEDYEGEILVCPTSKMRMLFGGKAYGAFPDDLVKPYYDETLYFTLRGELEAWILGMSDAEVRSHQHVKPDDIEVSTTGPRYRVRVGDDVVTSDTLVGAGGTNCPVKRKFFRSRYDRSDLVLLLEAELDGAFHGGMMHNHFYFDGLVGFGWVYPKGTGGRLTNIGVCEVGDPDHRRGKTLKQIWLSFVDHLKADGTLPDSFDPSVAEGDSLYLAQADGPVACNDDTCFIIGDAAALAHRDFWNGITSAVTSGKLAAAHIAGKGRYAREAIHPYLFRFTSKDTKLERRARDFVIRRALRRLHLTLVAASKLRG